MSERVPAQNKSSATPSVATQACSPLLHRRPLTDEQSESLGSNSNISKELGGIQPKTIRRSLNWQNISVEAPSRGNGMSLPGGIQRQQEEQKGTPAIEHQVSAKKAETSTGQLSNLTRVTEARSLQPKTDRGRLNWRNISVEAPARSGESSSQPMQRQQIVEKGKSLLGKDKDGKDNGKPPEKDKVKIPDGRVGESVTFNAPDEGHRLWIELKGGEPVVMVASTPEQAEVKLNNIVGEIQGLPNVPPHLLVKARELLRRGYGLLNVTQEQINQRLDALRTNDNNVDQVNIRAEIDRRANSVPQRNELAHVFQELFEILYNATHLPEERSAEGAVAWYHGQMQDTMGSVDERGQDTSGFTTGEGRNQRSHQIPNMLGAVVDRENNNKTYFGMSAGNKKQPNEQRLANAYPPFRDQLRELTPNRPLTNRELTNCAEFEPYDKALSARGRDNANLDGLQDSAVLGNARDIKYIPRCDNCEYVYGEEHNH